MDRISAFMDGETSRLEARQTLLRLKQDDECCETWKTFHLIGDVMRGEPVLDDDFTRALAITAQGRTDPTGAAHDVAQFNAARVFRRRLACCGCRYPDAGSHRQSAQTRNLRSHLLQKQKPPKVSASPLSRAQWPPRARARSTNI